MTDIDEAEHEELDRHYGDPDIPVRGRGRVLVGEAAAAAGRAFLIEEYGSVEAALADARAHDARIATECGRVAG